MSPIMMGELQPIPWKVVRQDSGQALVVGPEHCEFFSKVKHLTFLPTRCLWTRAPSKAYEGVECMVETGVAGSGHASNQLLTHATSTFHDICIQC